MSETKTSVIYESKKEIATNKALDYAQIICKRSALRAAVCFGSLLLCAVGVGGVAGAAEGKMVLKLYWTPASGDVYRANLGGSEQEVVYLKNSAGGRGFAIDQVNQQIYLRTNRENGFVQFGYDGQDAELAFEFDSVIARLAVDQVHRQLYWVSVQGPDAIWRANLDGADLELVAGELGRVDHVLVDPAGEYYYWTDIHVEGFHRDATDGSGGTIINYGDQLGAAGFSPSIQDMFIDPVGERLYIADSAINSIVSMGLDGSDPQLLVSEGVIGPHAVAVDPLGGRVYWSNSILPPTGDPGPGGGIFPVTEYDYFVMSANLDGSDVRKEFVVGELSFPDVPTAADIPRDLAVIYVPVPEPSTAVLAALGGGAACAAKWRCACRQRSRCVRRPFRTGRLVRFVHACFRRR